MPDFTTHEIMVTTAARMLRDGEVVFVGIGIPNLAVNLARRTRCPNLVLIYESGAIGARPARLPLSIGDSVLVTGALGVCSMPETFQYYLQRGFIDVGFLGGAHSYFPDKGAPILRGTEPAEEKEYLTDALAREAVGFIDRQKAKPFFLCLTFNAVHTPMHASEARLKKFESIADPKRRTYAAMMIALDEAVGRVEWIEEPGYRTNADRLVHREELVPRIEEILRVRPTEAWIAAFSAVDVPCGRIRPVAEALDSPEVRGRSMIVEVEGTDGELLRLLGPAVKLSASPARIRRRPPKLGEHTDEVLAELGYAQAEVLRLQEDGVV